MRNYTLHIIRSRYFIVFFMLISLTASAQIGNLNKGDRVKVVAPGVQTKPIVGTVYDVSSIGMLVSYKDSSISIPFTSVRQLDISMGKKRHAGKGALLGAVAGGLLLGSIAVAGNGSDEDSCENSTGYVCMNLIQFSDGMAFAGGALAGALGGALIGGVAGALIKSDRWEHMPVTLSAGLTPAPTKSFSLQGAVSISIALKRKP